MSNLGPALGWGLLVGASLLLGAVAGARLRLPARIAAVLTAFGGGILLAAVAFELVPESDAEAGTALTATGLVVGTLVYVAADSWVSREESRRSMRVMARAESAGRPMPEPRPAPSAPSGERPAAAENEAARGLSLSAGILLDGVPESVALGLTIAEGELGVALLVGVVAGNLVESYGAARAIIAGGHPPGFAIWLLGGIGAALAAATALGGTALAGAGPELVGTAQALAAGAVMAVVSVAIIPYAFEEVHRLAASATVCGFVAGYLLS